MEGEVATFSESIEGAASHLIRKHKMVFSRLWLQMKHLPGSGLWRDLKVQLLLEAMWNQSLEWEPKWRPLKQSILRSNHSTSCINRRMELQRTTPNKRAAKAENQLKIPNKLGNMKGERANSHPSPENGTNSTASRVVEFWPDKCNSVVKTSRGRQSGKEDQK